MLCEIAFCLNQLYLNLTSLYPEAFYTVQATKLELYCTVEEGAQSPTENRDIKFLALEIKVQAQIKKKASFVVK